MFLGVVGSRRRDSPEDKAAVKEAVLRFVKPTLVSGGCIRGADRFAEELAEELGLEIVLYYPDMTGVHGRANYAKACYDRNKLIALKSDILIACVAPDRRGGTENTIKEFIKKDKCNYALHREILILV